MSRSKVIGIALAAAAVVAVMVFTGPNPETRVSTAVVTRDGGVCLQLEQWGMFGWVIRGQTYTASDAAGGNWHTRASTNPPCERVDPARQEVRLPDAAAPDVYRLCGLADELGCVQFRFTPAAAAGP